MRPLLEIPEHRRLLELRRAEQIGRGDRLWRRRAWLLGALSIFWFSLGIILLGMSWRLTDQDLAQAALFGALLVGNGGPWLTLVLAHWCELNG